MQTMLSGSCHRRTVILLAFVAALCVQTPSAAAQAEQRGGGELRQQQASQAPAPARLAASSVSETLNQAARDYQDKSYSQVIEVGRGVLATEPDNGRANLLVGLSYLQTRKYTNSASHLAKALAAGERVDIPIKHHHYVFLIGDVLCEGYLSFTPAAFEFRSTSQAGHEFSVPYGKVYDMVVEPMHGGRLRVKLGVQKEKKEDKKTFTFYLPRAYTARNAQGAVTEAHCDGCQAEVQEVAQLFQQLVVKAAAQPQAVGLQPADSAAAASARAQVMQELMELERQAFDSVQLGDRAAFAALMADEFVQKQDGQAYTKAQLLATIRPSPLKLSYSYENVNLSLDGDKAVVAGVAVLRGQKANALVALRQRFTDTFVRRDGRWLALNSEVTTIK